MPTPLASIFSTIDSYKRRGADAVQGLLSDPAEYLRQALVNKNNEAGAQLGLLGELYKDEAGNTTLDPKQWSAKSRRVHDKMAGDLLTQMPIAGVTTWHGSPHTFDRFDSSKIGSGEGSQAYGRGLYLAESPAVARSYQESLSPSEFVMKGGGAYNPDNVQHWAAAELYDAKKQGLSNIELAQQMRRRELALRERKSEWGALEADKLREAWQQIATAPDKLPAIELKQGGALYKVDLPDEAVGRMLDWDKPMHQQAPSVREALRLTDAAPLEVFKDGGAWAVRNPTTGEVVSRNWGSEAGARKMASGSADPLQNLTGGQFYEKLVRDARDYAITKGDNAMTTLGASQAKASQDLLDYGIPGIRYLDALSRGSSGTSNFVVFPGQESLLTILERNGSTLTQP